MYQTPLFTLYKEYGGKTIDFGGWELPVSFSSIVEEHHAVRTCAGLFDVSHMGEFSVKGKGSLAFLQKLCSNDVSRLKDGRAQYTMMCNEEGGTIDDLIIYRKNHEDYLLVVNAGNIEKDFRWMEQFVTDDVQFTNVSMEYAQLALQGPYAQSILQKLTKVALEDLMFFSFKEDVDVDGIQTLVARTGYTGEDGFELYCAAKDGPILWRKLLEAGKEEGIKPCGLGARDTLRFEACLPLYGQELTETISPLEVGVGFAVKVEKVDAFIGQKALQEQKESGLLRKLVGIEMVDRGIPRSGYDVYANEKWIGKVTTGTQSPTLKKNIGLVLVESSYAHLEHEVSVEIRGKRVKAKIVATPFYRRVK